MNKFHFQKDYFSLIELLIVIAIFSILVSLLSPTLKNTKEHLNSIMCKQNLTQVFAAIQIYVNDSDGICPGPSWDGQVSRIYGSKNQIAEYIEIYLETITVKNGDVYLPEMTCPSNKELELVGTFYNRQNFIAKNISGIGRPFGRPDGLSNPQDPLPFHQIPSPSQNIVITEADFLNYPYPGASKMPADPVHFKLYRNTLYFDGHIDLLTAP